MTKKIVFCADGTWQNAVNNTNVYRLYKGLISSVEQVAYYDDGVGADGAGIERLIQGATGDGLLQKVKDGYTKIAHAYEANDEIFLFGFSRGAYTARSLAGMIAICGLPAGPFSNDLVDTAFEAYRNPQKRSELLASLASQLTTGGVRLIGVWDTVGALGIPAIFGEFDEEQFGFLDTTLHPDVKEAYHCVSVDESRRQFPATLWSNPQAGQILEQVYFAGCHGDVGGGTTLAEGVDGTTRLCDIPLGYMVKKAKAAGLEFDASFLSQCEELKADAAFDRIRDTWKPSFGPPKPRVVADDAIISNSVQFRVGYAITYRPPNLQITDDAIEDSYTFIEEVLPLS